MMLTTLFLAGALAMPAVLPVHYHDDISRLHRQHMEDYQRRQDRMQRDRQHREILQQQQQIEQRRRMEQQQRDFQRQYLDREWGDF